MHKRIGNALKQEPAIHKKAILKLLLYLQSHPSAFIACVPPLTDMVYFTKDNIIIIARKEHTVYFICSYATNN